MAGAGGNVSQSIQSSLGIPPGTKFFSPFPFAGMNLIDSPTAIADSEFVWIENFLHLGNGNMRAAWDKGASIFTGGLERIIYFDFYTIGAHYYCAVFTNDGAGFQVDPATMAFTTMGPPGTFYVPGGRLPATRNWGTRYLLIANRNTSNDYWAWDGTTLFGAGSLEPDSAIVTNGGTGYTTAPTVTVYGGSGSGATVTAQVNAGSVVALTITNPGTGYQVGDNPQLAFSGGGSDTSAILQANLNSGSVAAVNITAHGTGYTSATIGFSGGGGSGAAGTVILGTGVASVTVTAGGTGYFGAAVAFTGGGGSGALAHAVITGGIITAIVIDVAGTGYTSTPTVVVTGDGTGATGTATIEGGIIKGVMMTSGGTGYTSAPTVAITGAGGSGATGVALLNPGSVSSVTVVDGGSGYRNAPGLTFLGGGGFGATGIVTLTGTSIASINVSSGGQNYQVAPSVVISGGGAGTGATATAVIAQGQVVQIIVTNGGSGYTTQPLVLIEPHDAGLATQDTGSGATAQAVLVPTSISGVIISSSGSDYTSAPAVVLSTGANDAAAGIISLMPYGVSGAALETYQQRVWIVDPADPQFGDVPAGGNFQVSAPGSFTDFATSDGGVQFTNSDGFLQTKYTAVRQSNGYLYMFGDGSISIISSVSTAGNPATTTFNYQNVDPQTGATFYNSVQDFGKTILFGNEIGVFGLYGGTATLASQKLTPLFNEADFTTGVAPSSAVATIFGVKHYMMLVTAKDPDTLTDRNVMATWNERDWTITSQTATLTFINTQKVGSELFAWGTDGLHLYPLFNAPSTALSKKLYTKLYGGGASNFIIKMLDYHYIQAQDKSGAGLTFNVDIAASGMTPQPADPDLAQMPDVTIADPWVIDLKLTAPYPYWPVFATRCFPGVPFFAMGAKLTTNSSDFILGNWSFSYLDQTAHMA